MGNRWVAVGGCNKWLDYGVLVTILLYRLVWDFCILAVDNLLRFNSLY